MTSLLWSRLAVSGGLLHLLHSVLSLLALFFLLYSVIFVIRMLHMPKSKQTSKTIPDDSTATIGKSVIHAQQWARSELKTTWSHFLTRSKGRVIAWYWIFAACCLVPMVLAAMHFPQYPTYEFYNVKVLSHPEPNSWWMEKDDGPFYYTACPDFPNDEVIWAGYIARKVRYEEHGNCKSILRQDLGFWWMRDQNGNVQEITDARAAGQMGRSNNR